MKLEKKIQFQGVYYLETQNPGMNPIAIRPEMTPSDYVAWEDTGHGRILRFDKIFFDGIDLDSLDSKKIADTPKVIKFISKQGDNFSLVLLTLKIFNDLLKEHVACGGSLNFKDDRELQDYYLKTDFYGG